MNKKFKFTSAVLSAGLLITPVSGLVNQYDNVAKANANENINNNISEKDIKEGNIIKDYLTLHKKEGKYVFYFNNDESLEKRLKEIDSKITTNDISAYIAELNDKLKKENGKGPINDAIKEIQYYSNLNKNSFRSVCGNVFTWVSLTHGLFYGVMISGPVGVGLGAFTGLAYAIGSTIACP